jgi:glutamate-1-semialdehyde 2,1-aminomutase
MGCVTPTESFLGSLRNVTAKYGSVLIFDEVMCGFRVAYGGAQSIFGVTPDLTTMGKIVGGGLPVGGRSWNMFCPLGKSFKPVP